jgi:hypothetical protein
MRKLKTMKLWTRSKEEGVAAAAAAVVVDVAAHVWGVQQCVLMGAPLAANKTVPAAAHPSLVATLACVHRNFPSVHKYFPLVHTRSLFDHKSSPFVCRDCLLVHRGSLSPNLLPFDPSLPHPVHKYPFPQTQPDC